MTLPTTEDVVLRLPTLVVYADLRNGKATLIPRSGTPPCQTLTLSLEQLEAALFRGVELLNVPATTAAPAHPSREESR